MDWGKVSLCGWSYSGGIESIWCGWSSQGVGGVNLVYFFV